MQSDDFVTLEELREIRRRAASEWARFLGRWFEAAIEVVKRMLPRSGDRRRGSPAG